MSSKNLCIFDFDGVISTKSALPSHDNCVIVTGRCYNESDEVYNFLFKEKIMKSSGGHFPVYFNMMPTQLRGYDQDSRYISALHKCNIARNFISNGVKIDNIYEDDEIQFNFMKHNLKCFINSGVLNLVKINSSYVDEYLNKINKK